ncbi:flagellar assembly protein FliH [Gemmobacter aquatilis]|uniref:Flagellar assembly protein FliH n=1 Tax=Gemmobacter aquatilis TaxID=933059 RepID=A0A1H7Z126_9RHOB|nr:flagellar biosynthesis protein [Gemmobacter aquatilis]SEM52150.1 flagellar assembly protein FliH [Gemmobacter aquatilis]
MAGLKLEVFATGATPTADVVVTDQAAMEDARLHAYEQGYTAGWEDATAAQVKEQAQLRADATRNIQALGFTFQEAQAHVLKALAPLLQEVVGHLLPELARESLGPTVLESLMPLAEEMAETPVTLVLNPVARPAIEALLEQATGLPIAIVEEPTLSEGQVYLRLGDSETHIDLDRATAQITAAVRGFFGITE